MSELPKPDTLCGDCPLGFFHPDAQLQNEFQCNALNRIFNSLIFGDPLTDDIAYESLTDTTINALVNTRGRRTCPVSKGHVTGWSTDKCGNIPKE